MQNAVWSIDLSKKIKQAKAGKGIDVVCAHCGELVARLEPPDKHNMYAKEAPAADHEYKRDAPEHLPEVNHGQDIVCSSCGNVAAVLRPIRNGVYAKEKK